MIDDLRALAIFAKVAQAGSFSGAARALRLSTSVVSHHVKTLENRHGVSLFHRSTRSLSLTGEGKKLLTSASRMVEAAEEGLDAIADTSTDPAGTLRVSVPAFSVNSPQETAIWQFANDHPNVELIVETSDERINLVAEGFDLAIWLGDTPETSLRSQQIGTAERRLVATPSYLAAIEEPANPADLVGCDFVLLNMLPAKFVLQQKATEFVVVPERFRVVVNSVAGARSAILADLGIQHLMPQWSLPTLNMFAVWPESSQRSSLVRLLLEYLQTTG